MRKGGCPHDVQTAPLPAILHRPDYLRSGAGIVFGHGLGLGKTVITLTAVQELIYNRLQVCRCLVIAPKKVAEATWNTEAAKWDHLRHLRFSMILGSTQKRIRAACSAADIYITNRENVVWLVDYFKNAWPFDMVVIDESSSFKSNKAKRFKSLTWIRPHVQRIVELTGTPAPNSIQDLWAQLYLLDGGIRLGRTVTGFREMYFTSNTHGGHFTTYEAKADAQNAIQEKICDICISMKTEDYLQLPELVYDTVPVRLDSKAMKAYKQMEKEMLLAVDETIIDAGSAAALSNKLLQLCNGAVYDENRKVVEIHGCKLEAFSELLEGLHGAPALVFYNFQHDMTRIMRLLAKSRLRVRALKNAQDAADWNNRQIDILLAHPASCAYGLNLQQGGNHVIWFGLNWSLELYQQANKRLHRQGQSSTVFVHHLAVSGARDDDVLAALQDKNATQDALIESLKARIRKVKEEKEHATD